jgi:hypothetical protein
MKKQLLIAAVAATMSVSAMADISIAGSAKANSINGVVSIESDLVITGKSGDTSVVAKISLDSGMNAGSSADAVDATASTVANAAVAAITPTDAIVEDLYLTTSFEGVNIKIGEYRSGASELDQTSAAASTRYNLSTSMGGITVAYEATAGASDVAFSGTIAGVSVAHKIKSSDDTETTVSGSLSGVNLSWNQEHDDSANTNDTAITVSTAFSGVTATYVKIDAEGADVVSDGYVGKFALAAGKEASAFGLSTSLAGNTVTFKSIDIADADSTKIIVNRALASGATFEAVYTDNDGSNDVLDLELAVKF